MQVTFRIALMTKWGLTEQGVQVCVFHVGTCIHLAPLQAPQSGLSLGRSNPRGCWLLSPPCKEMEEATLGREGAKVAPITSYVVSSLV